MSDEEELILEIHSAKAGVSSAMVKRAECATASVAPEAATSEDDPSIESFRKEFQGLKSDVAHLFPASVAASEALTSIHVTAICARV